MKNVQIRLMSVEKDGLPEPDMNKMYFVIYNSGCGYGSYHQEYENDVTFSRELSVKTYSRIPTGRNRWYLDFDGVGHEKEIERYFELPEMLWA